MVDSISINKHEMMLAPYGCNRAATAWCGSGTLMCSRIHLACSKRSVQN